MKQITEDFLATLILVGGAAALFAAATWFMVNLMRIYG